MRYRCVNIFILILVGFLIPATQPAVAQATGGIDKGDPYPLISFRGSPKPKFFLTLDRTSSFVGGRAASTNELKFGLEFRKKLKLGIGFGALVSDVVAEKTIVTPQTKIDSLVNAELTLSFLSLNAEYVFYDSKRWQVAMPLSMGFGSSYFSYFEDNGNGNFKTRRIDEGDAVVMTATGMVTYRIFRWVGVSAGAGYRIALISNDKVQESFNSPVYAVRLRIFLGEIYKTVFPRGISGKRNPPYSNEYWD